MSSRRRVSRKARGGARARRRLVVTLVGLGLIAPALVACVWLLVVYPRTPGPGAGRDVVVVVPEGASIEALAALLGEAGVLERPLLFEIYMRLLGADERLRSGELLLEDDMPPGVLARNVAFGLTRVRVRVTIPEGFTRFEVARRLEDKRVCAAAEFLAATVDPELLAELEIPGRRGDGRGGPGAAGAGASGAGAADAGAGGAGAGGGGAGGGAWSAEGYLFPDTYELREEMTPRAVIARMTRTFRARALPLLEAHGDGMARLRRELGWSLHEAVIMASIVEKEAARAAERPRIAGVFVNRLRSDAFLPHRLQADPTVSYGCLARPEISEACRAFDGRSITRAMLRDAANPYNTYRVEGLPPGPICNPGADALRAVLAHEEHGLFYFVAKGGGRHHFSRTLEEHEAAVARRRAGGP